MVGRSSGTREPRAAQGIAEEREGPEWGWQKGNRVRGDNSSHAPFADHTHEPHPANRLTDEWVGRWGGPGIAVDPLVDRGQPAVGDAVDAEHLLDASYAISITCAGLLDKCSPLLRISDLFSRVVDFEVIYRKRLLSNRQRLVELSEGHPVA